MTTTNCTVSTHPIRADVEMPDPLTSNRILVIDDNPAIHEDFRKVLTRPEPAPAPDAICTLGSGDLAPARGWKTFWIDSAFQGQEGVAMVEKALQEQRPYAMAFVDMRMPPGWDGIQTALEIWKINRDTQIVICTAYSHYSWDEVLRSFGYSDSVIILKKPFDPVEVLQLAISMTEKWRLSRQSKLRQLELERMLEELRQSKAELERTSEELRQTHWHLRKVAEVLPVCVSCEKISTGESVWRELTDYLLQNSIAVSHGCCPSCSDKLLAEWNLK